MAPRCVLMRPGIVPYADALELQARTAAAVAAGGDEALILLEHPPTYTLGARGATNHLLLSRDAYAARGAAVVETDRGGDVTFHGPGQLVGYPILDLRRHGLGPVAYVRALEQVMIDAVATFGVTAARTPGRPGVWCGDAKIGAIGVRISRGITRHGFALNVNTDLSWFNSIVPCGLPDARVTSMAAELRAAVAMRRVDDAIAAAFAGALSVELAEEDALAGAGHGR